MSNDKNNAAATDANTDEVARILDEAIKDDFRNAVFTASRLADDGGVSWMWERLTNLADRLLIAEVARAKATVSEAYYADARGRLISERTGKGVHMYTTDFAVRAGESKISVHGFVVIGGAKSSISCHLSDAGKRLLNAYATAMLWYASGNHDIDIEPSHPLFVQAIIDGLFNTKACALLEASYTLDFARRDVDLRGAMAHTLQHTLRFGKANSRIFKAVKRAGRADEMLEEGIEVFRNHVGRVVYDCVKTHANNAEMIFVRYEDDTTEVFPAATIVEVRAAC